MKFYLLFLLWIITFIVTFVILSIIGWVFLNYSLHSIITEGNWQAAYALLVGWWIATGVVIETEEAM